MLSIQPSKPQKCTPSLLPARINHNGPINDAERYWKPETDEKGILSPSNKIDPNSDIFSGKRHAYFRGRHLHGTTLPLPKNYSGAILHITDKQLPQSRTQPREQSVDEDGEDVEVEESMSVEVKIAEQIGEFDQVIVWGHGGEVDEGGDAFIRGMNEWVGFAESMHVHEDEDEQDGDIKPENKSV
jgi:ribonuclease H2 subunit C